MIAGHDLELHAVQGQDARVRPHPGAGDGHRREPVLQPHQLRGLRGQLPLVPAAHQVQQRHDAARRGGVHGPPALRRATAGQLQPAQLRLPVRQYLFAGKLG